MTNYPDDFKGTNMDATWQPGVDCPDAYKRVMTDQLIVEQCLEACTNILLKHGRFFLPDAMEGIVQAVATPLWDDSESEIKELTDNQYLINSYPEDYIKLCTLASEKLADAKRVKKIDYAGLLADALQPPKNKDKI